MKTGHRLKDCTSDKACAHCGKTRKHHRSLCLKKFPSVHNEIAHVTEEAATPDDQNPSNTEESLLSSGDIVLMQTAKTIISNPSSHENKEVRLLLDSGSQRTYITETLAKILNLKFQTVEEISVVTFGSDKPKTVKTPKVTLNLQLADGKSMTIDANVVPKITGTILRRPISLNKCENWNFLWDKFSLADSLPTSKETATVELLVGNDYYLDIILPQKIMLQTGLYLLGSKLGWILTGRATETDEPETDDRTEQTMLILNSENVRKFPGVAVTAVDECIPMKPPIENYWNLETIGINEPPDKNDDIKAMENFDNTVKFDGSRYLVTWPWKTEEFELPDNKDLAYGRFRSLLYRLKNKPELFEKYNDIITDQTQKEVIEKVDTIETDNLVHYIPHHAVVDTSKPSTKVRIVYDASA